MGSVRRGVSRFNFVSSATKQKDIKYEFRMLNFISKVGDKN